MFIIEDNHGVLKDKNVYKTFNKQPVTNNQWITLISTRRMYQNQK